MHKETVWHIWTLLSQVRLEEEESSYEKEKERYNQFYLCEKKNRS